MYIQPTVKNVPSDCAAPAAPASSALRTENSKSEIRPNFRSSSVLKTTFQNLRRKQDKNRKICIENHANNLQTCIKITLGKCQF